MNLFKETTVSFLWYNVHIEYVSDEDLSSKIVSQRLFVSEASLSRFAKKLGFSGY